MVLDSVIVYTLCYFSKVCCAGAFFLSNKIKEDCDPAKQRIYQLLSKKILEESDISYFNPFLNENFTKFSRNLVKVSYVTALLCVRNMTMNLKLRQALDRVDRELNSVSRESEKWKIIGYDAYKEKRYEEAVDAFTSAMKYNPYCLTLLKNRAHAYLRLKRYDSSALDYYTILVLNPMSIKAYYKLSYVFLQDALYYESYLLSEFAIDKFKDCKLTNPRVYISLKKIRDNSESIDDAIPTARKTSEGKETSSSDEEVDIPDLIEASDSDMETPDIPDLMDASNSEESDSEVVDQKGNGGESKTCSPSTKPGKVESCYKDEKEKREHLFSTLEEASHTLFSGCSILAGPRYREALNEIKSYPEIYHYEECDIVCIKYAYGCASCKSKSYDDLQKAICIFKEIIEEHDTVIFPAAHYGIGLAYYKLNWFKDALGVLKTVYDILERGIPFKVYTWPGLTTVIEETKPEYLKVVVNDLIKECENPPPPDAICRFDKCSLRPSIYLTDPDFKGFFFIQCSDLCCLQYHPQCWKILRSSKHCTDKAFLEQKCFTPDCIGIITRIQNICRDGNIEKTFSSADKKKVAKQKRSKSVKKVDMKEEKKRRRKDSSSKSESISETAEEIPSANQPEIEVDATTKEPKNFATTEVKETVGNSDITTACQLSADVEPFIVLKKEKFVKEYPSKVSTKSKEHKKAKNTFPINEFLQHDKTYGNDYAQRLNVLRENNQSIIEGSWSNCNKRVETLPIPLPFGVYNPYGTEDFQPLISTPSIAPNSVETVPAANGDSQVASSFFDTPVETVVIERVKKEVYSYLKDLLQKQGPLRIDDPILIDELKDFPPIANQVIADCDGIGGFLKKHIDFALVGETYVCVVADVVAAYEKYSTESLGIDKLNAMSNYTAYSVQEDKNDDSFNSSDLNPDAKEYLPTNLSCASSKDSRSEAEGEKINRNSDVLISAISKLRQPLAVDMENASDGSEVTPKTSEPSEIINYTEPSLSNTNSYSQSDISNSSSPEEMVAVVLEKFTAAIKTYYSDEMNQHRPYIEECLKPYCIIEMPKKNNVCIQTDDTEVQKVSKGTMKMDEELQQVKQIADLLTENKAELLQRVQLLEEELNMKAHCAENSQKKSDIDLASLKNELLSVKLVQEDQKAEFHKKEIALQQENVHLLELLKKSEEVNSSQKSEMDQILSNNESLKTKVKVLEENAGVLQTENQLLKQSLDLQLSKLKDNIKTLETENSNVLERAKYAERLLLCLKKSEYLRRIENKATEASQSMKQLQEYRRSLVSVNINPVFVKNMELLLSQIKEYIIKLHGVRKSFLVQIDEQINEVNNGTPLREMKPIDTPDLPEIPSFTNTTLNLQSPCWTPQVQALSSACNTESLNSTNSLPVKSGAGNSAMLNSQCRQPDPPQPVSPQKPSERQNGTFAGQTFVKKMPPGIQNSFAASNLEIGKPHVGGVEEKKIQTAAKPISRATSVQLCASSLQDSVSTDSKFCSKLESIARKSEKRMASPLELDYNIKKKEEKEKINISSVSQENIHHEPKNSYEKLLHQLHLKFPEYTQVQLMDFVKEFRGQRKGKLSGLSMDSIINHVSSLIEHKKIVMTPVPDHGNKFKASQTSKVLVNKKLVSDETKIKELSTENTTQNKCPWGKSESDSSKQWSGNNIDDGCIICYEDMSKNAYKVDCGHSFHFRCIKEWLRKKSDCPICRVHLLLPDDYPTLK